MKNTGSILAHLISGAIIGAAATMCLTKKEPKVIGKSLHQAILEKLNFIQGHIDECCCMMGACDCKDKEKISEEAEDDGAATTKK